MLKFGSFSVQEPGPFHLSIAQDATATGGSNEVDMTLYVLDDSGSSLHAVGVQMVAKVARDLGVALLDAAEAADRAKRRL